MFLFWGSFFKRLNARVLGLSANFGNLGKNVFWNWQNHLFIVWKIRYNIYLALDCFEGSDDDGSNEDDDGPRKELLSPSPCLAYLRLQKVAHIFNIN